MINTILHAIVSCGIIITYKQKNNVIRRYIMPVDNNINLQSSWSFAFANYAAKATAYTFAVPITKIALGRFLGAWAGTAATAASPLVVPIAVAAAPYIAAGIVKVAEKTTAIAHQALINRGYRNLPQENETREIETDEDGILIEKLIGNEIDMDEVEVLERDLEALAELINADEPDLT